MSRATALRQPDRLGWLLVAAGGLLLAAGLGLLMLRRLPLTVRANILYHREPIGPIAGGLTVGQTIRAPYSGLTRIGVSLADYARANTGPVYFRLLTWPGGEVVAASEFRAEAIRDDMYQYFDFAPLPDSAGREYYFELAAPGATFDNCITAYFQPSAPYPEGEAYHGGQPVPGDLEFMLYFEPGGRERAAVLLRQVVAGRPGLWGQPAGVLLLGAAYLAAVAGLLWSLARRPAGG